MQETQVQSPGWEGPLEKGMATHSSILACKNPMDRGAWQAIQFKEPQRVRHNWVTLSFTFTHIPPRIVGKFKWDNGHENALQTISDVQRVIHQGREETDDRPG